MKAIQDTEQGVLYSASKTWTPAAYWCDVTLQPLTVQATRAIHADTNRMISINEMKLRGVDTAPTDPSRDPGGIQSACKVWCVQCCWLSIWWNFKKLVDMYCLYISDISCFKYLLISSAFLPLCAKYCHSQLEKHFRLRTQFIPKSSKRRSKCSIFNIRQ